MFIIHSHSSAASLPSHSPAEGRGAWPWRRPAWPHRLGGLPATRARLHAHHDRAPGWM